MRRDRQTHRLIGKLIVLLRTLLGRGKMPINFNVAINYPTDITVCRERHVMVNVGIIVEESQ